MAQQQQDDRGGRRHRGGRPSDGRESGDRSSDDRSSGGRESGGRSSGDRPSGGRDSGGRSSGDRESGPPRVSGLDVFSDRVGRFLATFFGLWAVLAGLLSYARIVTADEPTTAPAVVIIIIIAAAVTVGVAFPLSVGIVEGIPMVLANLLKKRYREEGFDEGVEKGVVRGRQEADADWEAWYERSQQAARTGEPFDEPPPTRNGRRPWDTDQDAPH